jgi:hypothetical protein
MRAQFLFALFFLSSEHVNASRRETDLPHRF